MGAGKTQTHCLVNITVAVLTIAVLTSASYELLRGYINMVNVFCGRVQT